MNDIITISACWYIQLYLPISEILYVVVWDWVGNFGTGLSSDLGTSSESLLDVTLLSVSCLPSPRTLFSSSCRSLIICIGVTSHSTRRHELVAFNCMTIIIWLNM